jgi:hypothetical protein
VGATSVLPNRGEALNRALDAWLDSGGSEEDPLSGAAVIGPPAPSVTVWVTTTDSSPAEQAASSNAPTTTRPSVRAGRRVTHEAIIEQLPFRSQCPLPGRWDPPLPGSNRASPTETPMCYRVCNSA